MSTGHNTSTHPSQETTVFNFTRSIATVSTLVVISVLASSANAQGVAQTGAPAAPAANCLTNLKAAGAFPHCKLTMEHRRLERDGTIIARTVFPHPIALSKFVAGDSAVHYALLYESQTQLSMRLQGFGVLFLVGPWVVNHLYPCHAPTCPAQQHRRISIGAIAGASLLTISIPVQFHGRAQALKSIAVYNASLAR